MFDQFPDPVALWQEHQGQILAAVKIFVLLVILVQTARVLCRLALRLMAKTNLGLTSLRRVRVTLRPTTQVPGTLTLRFPRWTHANKQGTANRRVRHNRAKWGRCTLRLGHFLFISSNPTRIYALAREARRVGHQVSPHHLEVEKYQANQRTHAARTDASTAASIYARFTIRPTDFEQFCADLFRARGMQVTVTPPTSDGGYDLILSDGHQRTIAECKCFAPTATVGRPLLQKLIGANTTVGAPRTLFITTGHYSTAAERWAGEVSMELIDGPRLAQLARETWGQLPPELDMVPAHYELTPDELLSHFPPDMRANAQRSAPSALG